MKYHFFETLTHLLKQEKEFVNDKGELLKNKIHQKALQCNEKLLSRLLSHNETKKKFFKQVNKALVFDKELFIKFIANKNFLPNSYTAFKNKIGLIDKQGDLISQSQSVVLNFPYKDCILEGGQTKEDAKRNEIFFNQTLAQDEISCLLEPKVLTHFKRINKNGKQKLNNLKRDENGILKENLIIKGNNLLVLYSLKEQFKGKVKLIYIDPPYNTGNDGFKYNDNFNHSSWLVFMKNRLEVARELLREDGVIFVQCDDNEQAYLKVLMDEVFGRENFVANLIWQQFHTVKNDAKNFSKNIENCIVFARNLQNRNLIQNEQFDKRKDYKFDDNDGKGKYKLDPLTAKSGNEENRKPFIFSNGVTWQPPSGTYWRYSFNNLKKLEKENKIHFNKNKSPMFKRHLRDVRKGRKVSTLWLGKDIGFNIHGDKEIKELFEGNKVFKNPKPEALLQKIIQISTQPNDIVLDYHLGSGTTCAVAHKMGRQYIGVEQMDYIEPIAVERMKKVIAGEQGGISKSVNWQGGGEFIYCELKKINQVFVEKILACQSKENIKELYQEIKDKAFLSYHIKEDILFENEEELFNTSLENQKLFLLNDVLDKNMLYLNQSEIESQEFNISEEDKKLNKEFYKEQAIDLQKLMAKNQETIEEDDEK